MIRYGSPILDCFTLSHIFKSIDVVESPEFRRLCMTLRESLTDADIPRRDKIREAILNQSVRDPDSAVDHI